MTAPRPVSIIVPAYREAPNLPALVERTFSAVRSAGIEAELIVVDDDSQDGTEAVIQSLQGDYPVRVVVRRGARGLSSAVLHGFAAANFDTFLVMDADLQHPPEQVPDLVRRLNEGDCDFVIATRYGGGGVSEKWPWYRRLGSAGATWLARPLAKTTDPMSGFFALHRETWKRAAALDPIGYKIALELLVKSRARVAESPIQFAARGAGQSKAGMAEAVRFLRHLSRLYRFKFPFLFGLAVCLFAALVLGLTAALALAWGTLRR